jgi:DNA-binding NarL/FixJ family response regulator
MDQGLTAIVCDDAPGFRALLSALLADAGVDVVARGETWVEALELAPGIDIVIVDLWMPELDLDALRAVRAAAPAATLAVVTALDLDEARRRIGDIPADLILSKIAPPAGMVEEIVGYARGRGA